MNKDLIKYVESHFIKRFKTNPILVYAPGRVNLIGEHTDYNQGFVFPAAIDKGIVVAIQKSDLDSCSIFALNVNEHTNFSLKNVEPIKNGNWKNYVLGVIGEVLKTGKKLQNFNLVFAGDIPSGAGLSSSAAIENSVAFGLNQLFNLGLTKNEMIQISQKAEHNYVGVNCGIMDQYASMFGQKDSAILLNCQNLEAKIIKLQLHEYSLLMINTNVKHSLAESAYNVRRAICNKVAHLLNLTSLSEATEQHLLTIKNQIPIEDYQKARYVIQENARVLDAYKAIKNDNLELVGKLLYASHIGLNNQYDVSCDELNFLVENAKNTPAVIGARMMGGGFGGCTINIVKNEALELYKKEIAQLYKKKFNIDCSFYPVNFSNGTQLIKPNYYES